MQLSEAQFPEADAAYAPVSIATATLSAPGVIARNAIDRALAAINADLGRGLDPTRIEEFYARSFCPELRSAPEILDLFRATEAHSLADSLLAPGRVREPSRAQIALRFPLGAQATPALLRPHIDGSYTRTNGVRCAPLAHFTVLCLLRRATCARTLAGNLEVWPGTHQGDVLLAPYQLGHAASPNLSAHVRYAVFFRGHHEQRDTDALDVLADSWSEFPALRRFAGASPGRERRRSRGMPLTPRRETTRTGRRGNVCSRGLVAARSRCLRRGNAAPSAGRHLWMRLDSVPPARCPRHLDPPGTRRDGDHPPSP